MFSKPMTEPPSTPTAFSTSIGAMLRNAPWFFVVLLLAAGCPTRHNPGNCEDGVCTDPARPFCDVDGTIAGSAVTCIAVTCTPGDFKACRGDEAVTCNTTGNDYDVTRCEHGCNDSAGGCVSCLDDTQCEAPRPYCTGAGACVECLHDAQCSDAARPVCDTDAHACRRCSTDDECPSHVCDFSSGSCIAESEVIYASPDGGTVANCGSQAVQCAIGPAFGKVTPTRHTIKLAGGTYEVATTFAIAAKSVSVHGAQATLSAAAGLDHVFAVRDGGALSLFGLTVNHSQAGSGAVAIDCAGTTAPFPTVNATRLQLTTAGTGLRADHCNGSLILSTLSASSPATGVPLLALYTADFEVARSTFAVGSGIDARVASTVRVHDCVFVDNATFGFSNFTTGPSSVSFSTFYNAPIRCGAAQQSPSTTFSDNIIVSPGADDVASGTDCLHRYEILQPQQVNVSNDHILHVDPVFRNAATHDFHLTPSSPAVDAADPQGQGSTDLDGIIRPQGAANDLGALEFIPST